MKSKNPFKEGDKVVCLDDSTYPDFVKKLGVTTGSVHIIREISEKDFGDGQGIRLQGVNLYSDLTGFEKAFGWRKFKLSE